MNPRHLQIKDFFYDLPENRLAKYPLPERDLSKLLICRDGKISDDIYRNIDKYLPEKSLLIFNNTKVIPARIIFHNSKGAKIEIFCLEPGNKREDFLSAMSKQANTNWICMVGKASKWKESVLHFKTDSFLLTAEIKYRLKGTFKVEFNWTPEYLTFAEILNKVGRLPIPPYLKRDTEDIDSTRYQTLYAKHKGSVAAPTAGLHFTESIFEKIKAKNISKDEVTLHVGAGTFQPVKSEQMEGHEMHSEWIDVTSETIENLLHFNKQNIIAVGTTSLRTIESLFWMGVKAKINPVSTLQQLEIKQWDVYESLMELGKTCKIAEALEALLLWMKKNESNRLICKTQIMIAPSYKLKIATAIITNFHQPNSTLLLLVAAVAGNKWKKIYDYALQNDFRFLSYGDGSLIFANETDA